MAGAAALGRNGFVWSADMIGPSGDKGVGEQSCFLRRTFTLDSVAGDEILTISAQGLYRAFINGQRVGHDVMTPGWTCYDVRLSYQTYQVAELLQAGENVIDIWLGDGWYRSQMLWPTSAVLNTWGDKVGAIAELCSGERTLLKTDAGWSSGLLPILKSGIYFGEIYDARQEGQAADGGVTVLPLDLSILIAHETAAVQELPPIEVVTSFADEQGRTVYDFGQNSGGYVAFSVEGEAGARVTVDHAEILNKHGQFDRASMRAAEARLEYVLKGAAPKAIAPISPSRASAMRG